MTRISGIVRLVLAILLSSSISYGYTVLTHEAIIDSVWDASLQKLLLKRFPDATPEELEQAHAYAYGGCIIQDMGYYPFSSRFFSDLTHYVRSGDFIEALIRESQDLNEYAFALGALEHYAADTEGHRIATNRAVPILYPELRRKYGSDVTYWDNPTAHVRTEFGFDVLQVASGRYAPDRYRSFIGFQVSRDLLERAFLDTYGIEMKDVFGNVTLALGSYRYAYRLDRSGHDASGMEASSRTSSRKRSPASRARSFSTISRARAMKRSGERSTTSPAWAPRFWRSSSDGFRSPVPSVRSRSARRLRRWRNCSWPASTRPSTATRRCSRTWTPAGPSCRTRISMPAEQPSPASTREPTKPTPSCWGSWRTVSSPGCSPTFARISWRIIRT